MGTGSFLYKIKYTDSPYCVFCKTEIETIEHLFWYCPVSKNITEQFLKKEECLRNTNIKDMIFGFIDKPRKENNLILIYYKIYIFTCRNNKYMPSIEGLKKFLLYKLKILCQYEEIEQINPLIIDRARDWPALVALIT
jgi:hypothetical protein